MKLPTQAEIDAAFAQLPGKRGVDIPEHIFDQIHPVASGITKEIWGDSPMPHELQWLYDNGHHTPEKIHGAYGSMPHPHAPSVTVSEYRKYASARQLWKDHQK